MIIKLFFVVGFIWVLLRLVQRERLALDLASFTLGLIVVVLLLSFSPFWVELLAEFLQFGTPSMAVVALIIVGLLSVTLVLSVMVSDLKRKQGMLVRHIARIELQNQIHARS